MHIQGYLAHKKPTPPPEDHHRALGIALLRGPTGTRFLMGEVPLYAADAAVNFWHVFFLAVNRCENRGNWRERRHPLTNKSA